MVPNMTARAMNADDLKAAIRELERVCPDPETGPRGVWSNLALTDKEDRVERQEVQTAADRADAAGGGPAQRSWGELVQGAGGVRRPRRGGGRSQYGGMRTDEAKELRRLRDENGRLKRMVVDLSLDNEMLKEVARGEF